MNHFESESERFKRIFSKSAELQATTEAKLNCLCDAYEEITAKGLAAIDRIEDLHLRAQLAQDFATALDRHLAVMEEFTCSGAQESIAHFLPPVSDQHSL